MTLGILLAIVVAVAAFLGFRKGMLRQVGALVGILLGIAACRLYGGEALGWMTRMGVGEGALAVILSYLLVFVAVYLSVRLIAYVLMKLVHGIMLGFIDRIGGAVFNVLQWVFIISLLLNLWVAVVPSHAPQGEWGERILAFAPAIVGSQTATELWDKVQPKHNDEQNR